jgi:hypothetical protein
VWINPARKTDSFGSRARVYATLLGAGAAMGGIAGAIVTFLLMR